MKLSFTTLSPAQQVLKAREIVSKMTGNPHYPTPTPSLADVTIAIDALDVAERAMDGSRAKTIIRNLRRNELEALMTKLQYYVQFASGGDVEIIMTSGMGANDVRTAIGFLPAPEWMKGKDGVELGSLDLRWNAVPKNSGYRVEYTTNPSEGWPIVLESEKASMTITGLTPGVVYYFRIATLSRAGRGNYTPVPFIFRPFVPLV